MSEIRRDENGILWSEYTFEYSYKRSLGPIISRTITDLRDGVLTGVKTKSGRVLFPPSEYDPQTGEDVGDFVEVQPTGTVQTHAWVSSPRPNHPHDKPFAWALVKLDGADTAFLHTVLADGPDEVTTGMRVKAEWKSERTGSVLDIAGFRKEG